MHAIIREGRRCVLAHMQEEYLGLHTDYMNDPEVNKFITSRPPFHVEQQREWFKKHQEMGNYVFAVLARDGKDDNGLIFIGVMDFRDVDRSKWTAHSASVIGNKLYWRRGIAREARLLQLKIGFDELGFAYIYSETVGLNVRSQRLLESTGYELIGVRQGIRMVEGTMHDELLYRVSRIQWLPHWERYSLLQE